MELREKIISSFPLKLMLVYLRRKHIWHSDVRIKGNNLSSGNMDAEFQFSYSEMQVTALQKWDYGDINLSVSNEAK